MTTLILAPGGRCDASCYLARGPKCDCICGGRFHGRLVDGTLAAEIEEFEVVELDRLERLGYQTTGLRRLRRSEDARKALEWEREKDELDRTVSCGTRRMSPVRRKGRKPDAGQGILDFEGLEAQEGPVDGCPSAGSSV